MKPVILYKWDDVGAPVLTSKKPMAVSNVIMTCLTAGYGDKVGAGWSLLYNESNNIVVKSSESSQQPFMLRMHSDDGSMMKPVCYTNMTSSTMGTTALSLSTVFTYGVGSPTSKWAIIAHGSAFWFFAEVGNGNGLATNNSGVYMYIGETTLCETGAGPKLIMTHTGGTWGITDDDRYGLLNNADGGGSTAKQIFDPVIANQRKTNLYSALSGNGTDIPFEMGTYVYMYDNPYTWKIPCIIPAKVNYSNYDIIMVNGYKYIVHGTSTGYPNGEKALVLVPIEYWDIK